MTTLSALATVAAAAMGIFMTFISWRVLKQCPILDHPVIPILVGALTFIGFRYRPGGMAGTICLGYEAAAISILFLLLFLAGARQVRNAQNAERRRRQDQGQYLGRTSCESDTSELNQFEKQQHERKQ